MEWWSYLHKLPASQCQRDDSAETIIKHYPTCHVNSHGAGRVEPAHAPRVAACKNVLVSEVMYTLVPILRRVPDFFWCAASQEIRRAGRIDVVVIGALAVHRSWAQWRTIVTGVVVTN